MFLETRTNKLSYQWGVAWRASSDLEFATRTLHCCKNHVWWDDQPTRYHVPTLSQDNILLGALTYSSFYVFNYGKKRPTPPPLLRHSAQFTCPSCKSCKHPFFKTICTTLTARISASYPSRVLCWCYHLLSQRTFSCQFIISAKNSPIYFLEVVFLQDPLCFRL